LRILCEAGLELAFDSARLPGGAMRGGALTPATALDEALVPRLQRAGLEIDSIGYWGNRQCVTGNLSRWAAHRPWHSLRNEPDMPVQVWAFARNPG
jgi:hypothetical protein